VFQIPSIGVTAVWITVLSIVTGVAVSPIAHAGRPEEVFRLTRETEAPLNRSEEKRGKVILMWEHIEDQNDKAGRAGDRDFEDFSAFVSYKQMHFQLWAGASESADGVEIGGYLRDRRRSTYGGLYRFREDASHAVEFDTAQVLGKGWVYTAMLRGIHLLHYDDVVAAAGANERVGDKNQLQFGTGFYYYWGDYNFLTARAVTDPRASGRWTFTTSTRLHGSENIYADLGWIIRTDRATGWFLGGKLNYFRWHIGHSNRFDWTDFDRTVLSAGVEIPF